MRTYVQKQPQSQQQESGNLAGRPAVAVRSHAAHPILSLQPTIGKHTAQQILLGFDFSQIPIYPKGRDTQQIDASSKTEGREYGVPKPRIKVAQFSPSNLRGGWPQNLMRSVTEDDKSESPSTEDQDQRASLSSFAATGSGVAITVEPEGAYSSSEFPDGFRWTQTITTNAHIGGPLLATPETFVDPRPNDDTKPFYWTDAEEVAHKGAFSDTPSRKPRPTGTVVWDAILSLNGVNGKNVTRFDSLGYGFSVESGGTVTTHGLVTPADVSGHLFTLSSEFPDWSFK